jgi:hypothetical protein
MYAVGPKANLLGPVQGASEDSVPIKVVTRGDLDTYNWIVIRHGIR